MANKIDNLQNNASSDIFSLLPPFEPASNICRLCFMENKTSSMEYICSKSLFLNTKHRYFFDIIEEKHILFTINYNIIFNI